MRNRKRVEMDMIIIIILYTCLLFVRFSAVIGDNYITYGFIVLITVRVGRPKETIARLVPKTWTSARRTDTSVR